MNSRAQSGSFLRVLGRRNLAVDMDLSHETNGSHGLSNSSKFLEMLLEKSLQDNCSPKIDDSDFAPMCDGVSEERRVVPLKCSSPLSVLIRDVRVPTGIDMDSENHERIYRVVCVASLVGPRKKLDHASCNEQMHGARPPATITRYKAGTS
jgi:hypothetical protein